MAESVRTVVYLAFGGWGDVQPLVVIATALASQSLTLSNTSAKGAHFYYEKVKEGRETQRKHPNNNKDGIKENMGTVCTCVYAYHCIVITHTVHKERVLSLLHNILHKDKHTHTHTHTPVVELRILSIPVLFQTHTQTQTYMHTHTEHTNKHIHTHTQTDDDEHTYTSHTERDKDLDNTQSICCILCDIQTCMYCTHSDAHIHTNAPKRTHSNKDKQHKTPVRVSKRQKRYTNTNANIHIHTRKREKSTTKYASSAMEELVLCTRAVLMRQHTDIHTHTHAHTHQPTQTQTHKQTRKNLSHKRKRKSKQSYTYTYEREHTDIHDTYTHIHCLCYNFCSLFGYHIAEFLNIPSLVCAPSIIPPSLTNTHKRMRALRRAHPRIFDALQHTNIRVCGCMIFATYVCICMCVCISS